VFLCKWLAVSRSGYYAWVQRDVPQRTLDDQHLLEKITHIFTEAQGRYGSPRVFKALLAQGIAVGKKRVERLMRAANLTGRVVRVTRRQPGLKRFAEQGQNHLLATGNATRLNQVWVADVTYLKVKGRWQYLATVMDQYSRRIIGWSLSATRTMKLSVDALMYALKKRGYPTDVVVHTDRGVEYTGYWFQETLSKFGLVHSVNRPGYCTDNAFMESFYHSLKAELIRGTLFTCATHLRQAIKGYINTFYNQVRLHSGIGYLSPMEYERRLV
jgi:transposase InsO family protein